MVSRSSGARRTQGVLKGRSDQVVYRARTAAIAELARSGYLGFRVDEVAANAGVNKTTLYRRWPTRAALVTAVVERLRAPMQERPLPDTGVLEKDLIEAFTRRMAMARTTEGRAWARLVAERYHPEVETIIGSAVTGRQSEWHAMVSRGIERGELHRSTDPRLVLEVIRAIIDARRSPAQPDRRWLTLAVRTALAGARSGTLTAQVGRASPRAR